MWSVGRQKVLITKVNFSTVLLQSAHCICMFVYAYVCRYTHVNRVGRWACAVYNAGICVLLAVSDSVQPVPVCSVNFCWYTDIVETELSLLD